MWGCFGVKTPLVPVGPPVHADRPPPKPGPFLRTAAGAALGRAKQNFFLFADGGQIATSWPIILGTEVTGVGSENRGGPLEGVSRPLGLRPVGQFLGGGGGEFSTSWLLPGGRRTWGKGTRQGRNLGRDGVKERPVGLGRDGRSTGGRRPVGRSGLGSEERFGRPVKSGAKTAPGGVGVRGR